MDHPFIKEAKKKFMTGINETFSKSYMNMDSFNENVLENVFSRMRRDSVISTSSSVDPIELDTVSHLRQMHDLNRKSLEVRPGSGGTIDSACLQAVKTGKEPRTTVMIRNIPNK